MYVTNIHFTSTMMHNTSSCAPTTLTSAFMKKITITSSHYEFPVLNKLSQNALTFTSKKDTPFYTGQIKDLEINNLPASQYIYYSCAVLSCIADFNYDDFVALNSNMKSFDPRHYEKNIAHFSFDTSGEKSNYTFATYALETFYKNNTRSALAYSENHLSFPKVRLDENLFDADHILIKNIDRVDVNACVKSLLHFYEKYNNEKHLFFHNKEISVKQTVSYILITMKIKINQSTSSPKSNFKENIVILDSHNGRSDLYYDSAVFNYKGYVKNFPKLEENKCHEKLMEMALVSVLQDEGHNAMKFKLHTSTFKMTYDPMEVFFEECKTHKLLADVLFFQVASIDNYLEENLDSNVKFIPYALESFYWNKDTRAEAIMKYHLDGVVRNLNEPTQVEKYQLWRKYKIPVSHFEQFDFETFERINAKYVYLHPIRENYDTVNELDNAALLKSMMLFYERYYPHKFDYFKSKKLEVVQNSTFDEHVSERHEKYDTPYTDFEMSIFVAVILS